MAWFGRTHDDAESSADRPVATADAEAMDAYSRTIIGVVRRLVRPLYR